jgi:gluconolactonase
MRLPADAMSVGLEGFRVLVEGLDHPEGVAIGPSGDIYAGGEAGQVYRIDHHSLALREVASSGGFMLGVTVDGDENVYCCDIKRREVVRVDGDSGELDVYSNGMASRHMVNPNWSAFDDAGVLYVTDSGTWHGDDGCIFRVLPGGTTELWSQASTNFPNGCCLTGDGRALLVLESCTPALVRSPVLDDGSAGEREVVAMLPGTVPDGVSLDVDGTAYVCCYRPDRILTVTTYGEVATLADDPEGTLLSAPTNSVWTGPDARLFVCGNLGRWHLSAAELGASGLALRYPQSS